MQEVKSNVAFFWALNSHILCLCFDQRSRSGCGSVAAVWRSSPAAESATSSGRSTRTSSRRETPTRTSSKLLRGFGTADEGKEQQAEQHCCPRCNRSVTDTEGFSPNVTSQCSSNLQTQTGSSSGLKPKQRYGLSCDSEGPGTLI